MYTYLAFFGVHWSMESNKTQKEQLQRLQNRGLRRILGAVRDTPIAVLHVESAILPLHERWRLLVSRRALRLQYYISPTSPLAGLKPSGPRKKYSPIHCVFSNYWSTMSKILHHR